MFSKQLFSNICLIVAALIWGTAFVAQTTGMEHIGPLTFTNLRFLIGGLIVLPLAVKEIPNFTGVRAIPFRWNSLALLKSIMRFLL